MREIEELYENMFCEQTHHKDRKAASSPTDAMAAIDSDDKSKPTGSMDAGLSGPPGNNDGCGTCEGSDVRGGEMNGGGEADKGELSGSEDSDFIYVDLGFGSSSEDNNSNDIDSEGKLCESYGFGDL